MATSQIQFSLRSLVHSAWGVPEIRGLGSLGFLRYSTKALGLGRLILITRWLSPASMGVYGLALLVLAVTEVVTETGVNVALLKHPNRLAKYIHTAWAVSIARGLIIAACMVAFSPFLQSFFALPELHTLLLWCAAIAAVKGLINPAVISFHQNLQFGKETLFRVPLQLIDLLSGLFLSWLWGSATGLLAGICIGACCEVLFSFVVFPQRPNLRLARWSALVGLYKETRVIVVNGIVSYLNEHADDILIGRLLGPLALGLYQTAYKLVSALTLDVVNVLGAAIYPILAGRQENRKEFRQTYVRALLGLSLTLIAVSVIFVGIPNQIVQLLFAPEWHPVGELLPWLFLAAAAKSIMLLSHSVAILTHTLRWHLLANLIIVICMIAGIYTWGQSSGILGASMAVAAAMLVVQPFIAWVTYRSLRTS